MLSYKEKGWISIETLVKTMCGENGKLYTVENGRRVLLATCIPVVKIYEHAQTIHTTGAHGYKLKTIHIGIVICTERETTRDVDTDFLRGISRFEFTGDFQREDGIFERIQFDHLAADEIALHADWEFEVIGQTDLIQKLLHL